MSNATPPLTAAYDTIQRDMEAAEKMQRSLLPAPSATLGKAHFDWLFLPALFVAGAILNYFRILDSHHVAFYLLDVSGHGVPSSMLSFTLSKILANNLLKAFGVTAPGSVSLVPPEKIITDLNQAFQGGSLYFTMIYAVLDTRTEELQFCQAGHPPPILLPAGKSATFTGQRWFSSRHAAGHDL
ncbi:MAG: SpoIIE family protein phosphatase [Gallionella sp.]